MFQMELHPGPRKQSLRPDQRTGELPSSAFILRSATLFTLGPSPAQVTRQQQQKRGWLTHRSLLTPRSPDQVASQVGFLVA